MTRLAILLGSMIAFSVHATPVLDQDNITGNPRSSGGCLGIGDCNWQQEVIAGVTGTLSDVTLELIGSGTVALDLFDGTPVQTSPVASTATFSFSETSGYGLVGVDVASLGFAVTAGSSFTMGLRLLGGSASVGLTRFANYVGDLGLIRPSLQSDCYSVCQYDFRFQTFVEPTSDAPEPSTALLLATATLLGARRVGRGRTAGNG